MSYDDNVEWARDSRENAGSCKSCSKKTKWLVLKGRPPISSLLRRGRSFDTIVNAVASRGWYCRECVANDRCEDAGTSQAAEDNHQSVLPPAPPPFHWPPWPRG